MLTVGAVLSLLTVTVTGAEVVRLPAASRATAVSVCEPLVAVVVFQGAEYGAVVTSLPATPSKKNCTPVTAVSSAALAVTVIVPETVAPEAGELMLTVGAVMSLATVTVTGLDVHVRPSESRATADRACEPLVVVVVFQGTEYGALLSSVPMLTPSLWNWTPATVRAPTTLTLALTGTVPVMVEPAAGGVTATIRLPGRSAEARSGAMHAYRTIVSRAVVRASLLVIGPRAIFPEQD